MNIKSPTSRKNREKWGTQSFLSEVYFRIQTGDVGHPPVQTALSFNVRSWSHSGLRYFVIGDASTQDLDKLSELMKAAG